MTDASAARRVVDIITGSWRAQALHAAVVLSLPDHIAAGHGTADALAARTGASADGLDRLLRLLAATGVVAGDSRRGYTPTPVSELLREGTPGSMRDMVRIYGEEFYRAWGAAADALRGGGSGFEHAFGLSLHEYLRQNPEAGEKFQRAMNAGNVFFPAVLEAFDFRPCRTVVDVAGGSGMLLATVLSAHPEIRGLLIDRPHMVPVAREYLGRSLSADRFEVSGGDIFDGVPEGADVYLLSRVLQDWEDERCVGLLAGIRKAMPDHGRLLVLERVIDSGTPDEPALLPLLWDLHLLMAAGGRERTWDGYRALLAASGLRLESSHALELETSLLVVAPA
ncbi:methyltransferase [Streptacidiphilus anmyonensis]|uniref:methyltransferase n=1 Tax=Streptacidiphilus anmyonensis TaxID=405782 RepID=UPI0005AB6E58|nr:methyltransferase [Streptacidiphilus anmyonensis]